MHDQPSTLPSTPSPARLPPARMFVTALLVGIAAALGLASVTRAADPSQGLLDAAQETIAGADTTTEALAAAAATVVDASAPVIGAAIEVAEPASGPIERAVTGAQPVVEQLEPAVNDLPPALEAGPLADALEPVVGRVMPIDEASGPLVPTIDLIDEHVSGAPGPAPLVPVPLSPDLTVPWLPVLDTGASDTVEAASQTAAARPTGAGNPAEVRVVTRPSAFAAFLPHPAGHVGIGAHRAGGGVAGAGAADAGPMVVAGSSIGVAILLALLLNRPPSWPAWLPDALGPPSSRTLTVLVPPG